MTRICSLVVRGRACVYCGIYLIAAVSRPGFAGDGPAIAHGLWVWNSPSVLSAPGGAGEGTGLLPICRH